MIAAAAAAFLVVVVVLGFFVGVIGVIVGVGGVLLALLAIGGSQFLLDCLTRGLRQIGGLYVFLYTD